jgi:hypothetical protein
MKKAAKNDFRIKSCNQAGSYGRFHAHAGNIADREASADEL